MTHVEEDAYDTIDLIYRQAVMGNVVKFPDPMDTYAGRPQRMITPAMRAEIARIDADRRAVNDRHAGPHSEHGAGFNKRQNMQADDEPLPAVIVFVIGAAVWVLAAVIGMTVQAWYL